MRNLEIEVLVVIFLSLWYSTVPHALQVLQGTILPRNMDTLLA